MNRIDIQIAYIVNNVLGSRLYNASGRVNKKEKARSINKGNANNNKTILTCCKYNSPFSLIPMLINKNEIKNISTGISGLV